MRTFPSGRASRTPQAQPARLEHMLERGSGRIVSVSSVIGETGSIGQANYAASKSGLFGLTKSLAKEAFSSSTGRSARPAMGSG
jgi:NAD(P)-dependent dehydrogenase (short-subunit alcohol dehydrogenase family)